MKLVCAKDYSDASKKAANLIAAQILVKPKSVIGLATGSTPLGIYKDLINMYNNGDISFADVVSINLDEYLGLEKTNEQSYYHYMNQNLHSKTDIKVENVHLPNGVAKDIEAECKRYDSIVEDCGGIDLQLLGIGLNGHVGFNEPSETITNDTYCVELTQSTIDANKRFFDKIENVPKKAFTMGLGTIMRARKVVMLVTGSNKAEILKETILGPITPLVPASLLRLHSDFTLIADSEAVNLVKNIL